MIYHLTHGDLNFKKYRVLKKKHHFFALKEKQFIAKEKKLMTYTEMLRSPYNEDLLDLMIRKRLGYVAADEKVYIYKERNNE